MGKWRTATYMAFYKLQIPSFVQYKFAWAELPGDANISDDFPKCPKCNRAIGQRFWLPPYNIIIKQPRNIGDFVSGVIGSNLIVSERFKEKYEESGMTGIEKFTKLNVIQMGSKRNTSHSIPAIYGATIKITTTQVDYEKMNVTWFSEPNANICDLCSPGGGGGSGIYQSYKSIVFKTRTLTDFDFFIPINFVGNIMLTERAKTFIEQNKFTNVILTAHTEAKHDIFKME